MQGITSQVGLLDEVTFGVFPGTPGMKRVDVQEVGINPDYGYKETETIVGSLTPRPNVRTKKSSSGNTAILAGPENGFTKFLKYLCGQVTTYAGYFHRERFIMVGAETYVTLTNVPVVSLSDRVFLYKAATDAWSQLARVVGAPAAGEYAINLSTGKVDLGDTILVGDHVIVPYCETLTGVYSHLFSNTTNLPSFQVWVNVGNTRLMEYTGCKVGKGTLAINAEDFLKLAVDITNKNVLPSTTTLHVFPPALVLSDLPYFLFKYARILIDGVINLETETLELGFDNKLEAVSTISCDDTVRKITPTGQMISVKFTSEFEDLTEITKCEDGTFFDVEVTYGVCAGSEIAGNPGYNYSFQIFLPLVRHEKPDLPVGVKRVVQTFDGFAWYQSAFNTPYEMVVVNQEATV